MKNKKKAQSLIEYGLILALVAVVAIAALQILGKKVNEAAVNAGSSVSDTATTAAETYCTNIGGQWNTTTKNCDMKNVINSSTSTSTTTGGSGT